MAVLVRTMCNSTLFREFYMPQTPTTQQPLIFTSKGNLLVDSLRYVPLWTIADDRIEFVEEYYLGDELVRRNVHINVRSQGNA